MIDLSVAPKRIQELMDEGLMISEVREDAALAGLEISWYINEMPGELEDTMLIVFFHRASRTRWLARFSGYDALEVEVFGLVNQWSS